MLQKYKVLHAGDSLISILLGKKDTKSHPALKLRSSCFVVCYFAGNGYLLFHTLTKKMAWIAPAFIRFFLPGTYTLEDLLKEEASELFQDGFVVREDTNEYAAYQGIRNLYLKKMLAKKQLEQFIILPVTACNARCWYCYEAAVTGKPLSMTDEMQDQLVRFMGEHTSKDKTVRIQWFGGEPLCGSSRIDSICQALTAAGIPFTSTMITNGSLFTSSLAQNAVKNWKLEEVQITLDGTKSEYEKRKRYLPGLSDPFGTVIQNIHHILAAGIRVIIRLNADLQNMGDLFTCVDFLAGEFREEEKEGLSVYAHELFSGHSDSENLGALLDRVMELNLYCARFFSPASDSPRTPGVPSTPGVSPVPQNEKKKISRFAPGTCMANPAGDTVVVTPDGHLYACEHMPENLFLGTLDTGIDESRLQEINQSHDETGHCRNCTFLPVCSDFSLCPCRIPWPHCRKKKEKEMKQMMEAFSAPAESVPLPSATGPTPQTIQQHEHLP